MDNVPLYVKQNVAIVSIFDLKNVADETIRSQTVAKVIFSFLIPIRFVFAELNSKIVYKKGVQSNFFFYTVNA